jgi:hypothetical protein
LSRKLGGGLAVILGLVVVLVLAAVGAAPWAAAAPDSPPGPDPADPAGPDSTFSFDFEDGDLYGRSVGHQVGGAVWTKALTYFNSTAT